MAGKQSERREQLYRDGFLVLEGFFSVEACDALRARMDQLVRDFDPTGLRTVFSTKDQRHGRDLYFLELGDKIRFFLEEEALDADGALAADKERALNKVGHALHDKDSVFDGFSRQPALAGLASELGLARPLLVQSMYIFKQPRIGGEVGCHQDSSFLRTEPLSCLGFWVALEDATRANGCMWALPGGHRLPLRTLFVREGDTTRMEVLDPKPLPTEGLVPLEAPEGTLVVLHGSLPHLSGPNRSPHSRHAYALHLVDGTCRWSDKNWLRRPADDPFRGFV